MGNISVSPNAGIFTGRSVAGVSVNPVAGPFTANKNAIRSWVYRQRATDPTQPVSSTNPLIWVWDHAVWFKPPTQTPTGVSGSNFETNATTDDLRAFWDAQTTDPTNTFTVTIEWQRVVGGEWQTFETASAYAREGSKSVTGNYNFAAQEQARVLIQYRNEAGGGPWATSAPFYTNFRNA